MYRINFMLWYTECYFDLEIKVHDLPNSPIKWSFIDFLFGMWIFQVHPAYYKKMEMDHIESHHDYLYLIFSHWFVLYQAQLSP